MKLLYRHLICSLGLILHNVVFATDGESKVTEIFVHSNGTQVLFRLDGVSIGGCATTNRYAIDVANEQGRAMYSAILSAKATSGIIFVKGKGVCNIHGDAEDVSWLLIR